MAHGFKVSQVLGNEEGEKRIPLKRGIVKLDRVVKVVGLLELETFTELHLEAVEFQSL